MTTQAMKITHIESEILQLGDRYMLLGATEGAVQRSKMTSEHDDQLWDQTEKIIDFAGLCWQLISFSIFSLHSVF